MTVLTHRRERGPATPAAEPRRGLTLIETVIGIAIFAISAFAIYYSFADILDISTVSKRTTAAVAVLQSEIETIRNIPYEDVGIQGGSPAGIIPASQAVTYDGTPFVVTAYVRNIDDPFDGTIGGTPNDTAPADYKLVELEAICVACRQAIPIVLTARVAPRGLETATQNGALFINVFDAEGQPISEAQVTVDNTSTVPSIAISDETDVNGMLQLVDIATSTGGYRIAVGKSGYSSDQTYPAGAPANPNPIHPHATVVPQAVTQVSFSIDRTASLNFSTADDRCAAIGDISYRETGVKLIGTSPDVLKHDVTTSTDGNGLHQSANLEWDTYSFTNLDPTYAIEGYTPLLPLTVDPGGSYAIHWAMKQKNPDALLVTVQDTNGVLLDDATTTLTKSGFSETLHTRHRTLAQTDWSAGQYATTSGDILTDSPAGELRLGPAGGPYATSTESWLESQTFDLGSTSTNYYTLSFTPGTQDPQTGPDSLRIQIASNNDQATWNYTGPDGTGNTYYTASAVPLLGHSGNRYLRYKAYLKTEDEYTSPVLQDISFEFSSPCVPTGQSYFDGLAAGTYALDVSRAGYQATSTSVDIGAAWQEAIITLEP